MKVILLTAIILTLVPGSMLQPCLQRKSYQAYSAFVQKHVLQMSFNRRSLADWASYLQMNGLCGREPVQSFIDAPLSQVEQICSPAGRLVYANLCISISSMNVYDVYSSFNGFCNVQLVLNLPQHVIVACDNVGNLCRPVHYQKNGGQIPGNIPCV